MTQQWGFMNVRDAANPVNGLDYAIRQRISEMGGLMIVKIISVNISSRTVDVSPMVDQVTPDGTPIPHSTIHEVPYGYDQAGGCLIKIDPVAGDIGVIGCSSRDITRVKRTWKSATPQTLRSHHLSDAIYLCTLQAASTPSHIISISDNGGLVISSPLVVKIEADAQITGNLSVGGNVTATGDVKAGSISLKSHIHSGVQTGGGTTGGPQ